MSRSLAGAIPVAPILAGASAILVGIGLARFAYTPLIPAVIGAGWFAPADAAYLGAANFAGYLAGAYFSRRFASWLSPIAVLRAMMLIAAASFIASAWPLSFLWFFVWRFVSGVAGGTLMALGPMLALSQVPVARRGVAGGIVFGGVGFGIVASGTLVPLLIDTGLPETWIALGLLCFVLAVITWGGWPTGVTPPAVHAAAPPSWALRVFYIGYALSAAALVPHMVFLVDFIARGLNQGLAVGGYYWIVFGIGAALGPLIMGAIADRIGFGRAWRLTFIVVTVTIALPAFATGKTALIVSCLVVGAFVPGIAGLALGRLQELVSEAQRPRAWSFCTISFAAGQAAGAYALSYLYAQTGSHTLLFLVGAGFLAIALLLDLVAPKP